MQKLVQLITILIIGVIIAGCSSSEDSSTPDIPTLNPIAEATSPPEATATPSATFTPAPTPTATATRQTPPRISGLNREEEVRLRFYNLIGDFDPVAVDISGLRFANRLPYGIGIPDRPIAAGTYPLSIVSINDGTPLLEQEIVLEGGTAVAGLIVGTAADPQLQFILEDQTPLEADETRFNVYNAVFDDDPIVLRRDGQDITGPLVFAQQSGTQIIPPGRATFSLISDDIELASMEIQPRGRTVMTIVIYSNPDNQFIPGFIIFDTSVPGRADANVIHMAPEMGPIDLYFDQALAASNLEYTRSTDRQVIPTGNTRVSLYAAGANRDEDLPIATTDFNVNPGEDFAVIVLGNQDEPRISRYEYDTSPVPPDTARVTFVHAVPDAPRVIPSIGNSPIEDVGGINYRNVSRSTLLSATNQDVNFYVQNGDEILEAAPDLLLEAGRSYLYFFTGRDETQPPILISEVVGVDEELGTYEGGPTPTPAPNAEVTFVNVLSDGGVLDFSINALLAAPGVPANTASPRTLIPGREASVEAIANGEELSVVGFNFAAPGRYTVYAYGSLAEGVSLLVATNSTLAPTENVTGIRLVNLAEEDTPFQLAYSANTGPLFRPSPDPTAIAQGEEDFYPISANMIRTTGVIEPQQASSLGQVPLGLQNLFVIDPDALSVAVILEAIDIQPGQQYEVIVRQPLDSPVQAIIISYPSS